MLIDKFLQLASNQTHNAATTVAMEDTVDLSKGRDFGIGCMLALVVNVKTGLAGTGGPTFAFDVQVDDANTFGSATTVAAFPAVAAAPAGAQFILPLPPLTSLLTSDPAQAEFRFLRGRITLTGTGPSITIDAQIMPLSMVGSYRAYPDNVTISG